MILRFILMLSFISTIGTGCQAQEAWTDKTRILPDLLRQVPVALFIQHSPNPNYPEINDTGKNKKMAYVWKHATTVCSPMQTLEIIKAGSFIWYDETGWKENVVYSKKDFKKRFECKSGILKKDECYTFEKNYRWGSHLYGGDALWYVLAEDENGKLYKGMAIIETESELQK